MTTRTMIGQQPGSIRFRRWARSTADFAFAGMDNFVQNLRTVRDREHLHAMPDSLLKDIGISRSQINQAVMFGRQVVERRGAME